MSVYDEVNGLSADMILSRLSLPRANDGKSYVCPKCDNGKGNAGHGHGDGIKPRNSSGRVRWKCFKCGTDFSNFDLAAATLGLDPELDKAESAERVSELFGIHDGNKLFSFSRQKKSARTAQDKSEAKDMSEKKSATESEPKNYSGFYKSSQANVEKFLAEHCGSYRGLTAKTFKRFGLGIHPNFGVGERDKQPTLIIPYDDAHFFARAILGDDKSHHGADAGLYKTLPIIKEPYVFNFIVEGEIDALSIAQADNGHNLFGCLATGSVSNWRKVVPELEKEFGNAESKPGFIVLFDNDEAGISTARLLVRELKAHGYPAVSSNFEKYERKAGEHEYHRSDGTIEKFTVEKVDANDVLIQNGELELLEGLMAFEEKFENELSSQAEAMAKSAERKRQATFDESGMKFFSFAEYFSADFFSDIALTAKYSERKTGFSNLDAAQVFMPGLYVLGALPGMGKTTFAWQLMNQLADNGEFCIYCSYEMSRTELYTKSLARKLFTDYPDEAENLNLSSVNIRRGAGRDNKYVNKIVKDFASSNSNLRVAELSNTDIAELIKELKLRVADADKPAVICLDYLQIVPSKDVRLSSTKEKVDNIMLRLKDFQRETNSTIIIISSFNRDNYFQPASFSSFKESGAIEYSADCIWALEPNVQVTDSKPSKDELIKESKKPVRDIKLLCLKNRNGGQYDCRFDYHAAHDYFEPREEKENATVQEHHF